MDFLLFMCAGVFAVGIYFGRRSQAASLDRLVSTTNRKASAANDAANNANGRYLEVLRRELANIISREDPDKMIALYRKAKARERETTQVDESRVQAELTSLMHKYPYYGDFDRIGTKHFVPYESDNTLRDEIDNLCETYLDISQFFVLTDGVSQSPLFPDQDDNMFLRCMEELKDRKFRAALEIAMDKYDLARRVAEASGSVISGYEDKQMGVFRLQSYADIRYGIRLKQTNEYGVYSFFIADDGKTSQWYCRSDASFENETTLRDWGAVNRPSGWR